MPRLCLWLSLSCALGCSGSPGSALRVTLDFSASTAQCGKVRVTGKTAAETSGLARGSRPSVVGVALSQTMGNPVTIEAFGWPTADCTGALVSAARPVDVFFPSEGVTEVPMALLDFGTDGGTGGSGGGDGGTGGGTGGGGGDGGTDGGTGGGGGDGGTDAGGLDAGRLEFPFTPTNFNPAISLSLTAGNVVLDCGVSSFDSRTYAFDNWCSQTLPTPVIHSRTLRDDVVVLALRGLTLAPGSTLELRGDKAVILAVYGDADLQGLVDADAEKDVAGPGGSSGRYCNLSTGAAGSFLSSAGGGGAGNLTAGSVGGNGTLPFTFGVGGSLVPYGFPDPLHGGCSGGKGAVRNGADTQASGGGGGGALQVSVAGRLTISGRLSVAGGGGRGGTANKAGGAGAGSGGGLHLEAQTLLLTGSAMLLANGGGGGGGAESSSAGQDGADGRDGDTAQADGGAKGGGEAGAGGLGESVFGPDEQGGDSTGGNGGGGGGGASAGRIHLRGVGSCNKSLGVVFSPPYTGACP